MVRFGSPARRFTALALALVALALPARSFAQTLVPTDVGHLGGGSASAVATAPGYVVGGSTLGSGDRHAYRWSAATGQLLDIGALFPGSPYSIATGVNASGEVVGGYFAPGYAAATAFYWSEAAGAVSITGIGNFGESPVLINASGTVAGIDSNGHLFKWTLAGGLQDLGVPVLGATVVESHLKAINARGDVVGNSFRGAAGYAYAFVAYAADSTVTVLHSPSPEWPNLPPARAEHHMYDVNIQINAINDLGVLAGTYWDFAYLYGGYDISQGGFFNGHIHNSHAFSWTPAGGFTDLGNYGNYFLTSGSPASFTASADAINNAGTIAGSSRDSAGSYFAFKYAAGTGRTQLPPRYPGAGGSPSAITAAGVVFGTSGGAIVMWDGGAPVNITPSFASNYPDKPILNGSMLAGQGSNTDYLIRAWGLALTSAPACPGLYFTDSLMGPSSPCLAALPAGKYGYTASGVQRTQSNGQTDRPMVTTESAAYLTSSDFTADVTVKLVNNDLLYFGLGRNDADPSYFNEPANGFYFRVHSGWQGNYSIQADVRNSGSSVFAVTQVGTYSLGSTITLRISRVGDNVTMSVVGGGSITYSLAAYPSLGLTNSNTRVFFGNTSVGSVFSNLKIYPSLSDTTAPVIDGPAGIVAEATGPGGATVSFTATAEDDVDGPVAVIANPSSGSEFAIGNTTVELSATDAAGNDATAPFVVTVQDTIAPSITSVPADQTIEATSAAGAVATYGVAVATDAVGVVSLTYSHASGSTFALGTTTVTVTAADAKGNASSASFTITVRDTTAPAIGTVAPSQGSLWPPNHKMVAIDLTASATDAVGSTSLKIISVTSSEPDNGLGDGDTAGDAVITGALSVNLRAERSGKGNGRTYTITVEARDAAGNRSTRTCTVFVPKSQGK